VANRRIIALVADGFGGRGGIATYTRNFLRAACSAPGVSEVIALPRLVPYALETMPANLTYVTGAANGMAPFTKAVVRQMTATAGADLIVCGHLHLLPFAQLMAARFRCPVLPVVYGYDAWQPGPHAMSNYLCGHIRDFVTIRRLTGKRLLEWAHPPHGRYHYLPNCLEVNDFGIAPKRPDLVARFGLAGRKVVLTAGRLDTGAMDQNKGFDEMLEALPGLARQVPDVTYLIMGDGPDQVRIEQKAKDLGVRDRVVFAGYVSEVEKADHYRLADAFAMPGSGALFDTYPFRFVFLEALACGVPVVGSALSDSEEADDPDVRSLITQVNPHDPDDIVRGVVSALNEPRNGVKPALAHYYYRAFEPKVHAILAQVIK
jgi:glycosyltransferase involved in cell wall biosynthesis